MPKASPVHSVKEDVYHDNSNCTERNNIEDENRRSGTGGKRQCTRCAELERKGE